MRQLIPCCLLSIALLPGCAPPPAPDASILLFNGTGSSPNDVKAVEAILNDKHLKYALVNSRQLNGMSESQLRNHRLLLVPGGNYITIGNGLTPAATTNIHTAVQNGLNYLGICAGGLLAGQARCNSLNLTSGVRFGFYSAVNRGVHKAAVPITCLSTPALEQYWEDGPEFTGWGDVVAKYPDGTPSVVEGTCGKGWVILCGVHPEAPENWRRGMSFASPASATHAYAATLIDSALNGTALPHY